MNLSASSLRRGLVAAILAVGVSLSLSAAENFEGRVHMDITSGKKKEKMGIDYAMKDGKLRMDPQMPENSSGKGQGMGMIFDSKAQEMIILMNMDGQKMYMKRPIPKPTETNAKAHDAKPMSAPVATGRTEMIAGYKATEYTMKDDHGNTIEMWLAKGLGMFMPMQGNPMGGRSAPPAGWESFARDGNYFPMRVVSHNTKGAEEMRMEVTSVDKGSVPDSVFSTAGYTEFSMPNLGGFLKH